MDKRWPALVVVLAIGLVVTPNPVAGTPTGEATAQDGKPLQEAAGGAIEVSDCRTIGTPGRYVLTRDIENSTAAECITIVASDVVFDGRGHTLDGRPVDNQTEAIAAGYTDPPIANVTIKNLVVTDWTQGIGCRTVASNVTIENVTALRNGLHTGEEGYGYGAEAYGIYVGDLTRNVTVSNSIAVNNAVGIYIANTSHNVIRDNLVRNNEEGGIVLEGSTWQNRIVGNRLAGNGVAGVEIRAKPGETMAAGNRTTISNNVLRGDERGILLDDTNASLSIAENRIVNTSKESVWVRLVEGDTTVTANVIEEANDNGIVLTSSSDVLVRNNTIRGVDDAGIFLTQGATGNRLEHNRVRAARRGLHIRRGAGRTIIRDFAVATSRQQSILFEGGGHNTLVNATVSGGHGVELESAGNHLRNITVSNTTRYGLHVDGASDTVIESATTRNAGDAAFEAVGKPANVTVQNLSMPSGRVSLSLSKSDLRLGPVDDIPTPPAGTYDFGIGAEVRTSGANTDPGRAVLTVYYRGAPGLDVTLWRWSDQRNWTRFDDASVHSGRDAISATLVTNPEYVIVPLASSPPPTPSPSPSPTPTTAPTPTSMGPTPSTTLTPTQTGTGVTTPGFGTAVTILAVTILCVLLSIRLTLRSASDEDEGDSW